MVPLVMAGIAVEQIISGAAQKAKAKKMARKNIRPQYEIQNEIKDNQNLVESRVSTGVSDATREAYTSTADRGLTASINAILKGGGSVNNIADIYDNYQGGVSKLALLDEQMRAKHVDEMITQNNIMAAEQDKKWQVNEYAPYADTAQAAAALKKQGSENEWKGINTLSGAVTNAVTSNMYKKEAADVFANGSTNTASRATAAIPIPSSITPQPLNAGGSLRMRDVLKPLPRQYNGSGMSSLDPIMIGGVAYDPITMLPI